MYAAKAADPRMSQGLKRSDVLDQTRALKKENESLVQQIELLQNFQGKVIEIMDMAGKRNVELEADIKMIADLGLMLQSMQPAHRADSLKVASGGTLTPTWTSTPTPSEVGDWPYSQDLAGEGNDTPIPNPMAQGAQAGTVTDTLNPMANPDTPVAFGDTMAPLMTVWQMQDAAANLDWEDCD